MGHGRRTRRGHSCAPKLKRGSPDYLLLNSCLNNVYPDVSSPDPGVSTDDAVFSYPDPATYDYELRNPDQPARSKVGAFTTPPQPRGPTQVCGEHSRDSMLGPTNSDRPVVRVGMFLSEILSRPVDQSQFENQYLCEILPLIEDQIMYEGLTPLQRQCRNDLISKAYCLKDLKQSLADCVCSSGSPLTWDNVHPIKLANARSALLALALSLDIHLVQQDPLFMVVHAQDTLRVLSLTLDICIKEQDPLLASYAAAWQSTCAASPVAKPGDVSPAPGNDQTDPLSLPPNIEAATVPSPDGTPGYSDTNDTSTLTPADQSCEVPLEYTYISLANTKALVSENKSLFPLFLTLNLPFQPSKFFLL
ncbi:hypothetical protein FKM82_024341 [Ascaphus truei]